MNAPDQAVTAPMPHVMNTYGRRGSLGMINLRERTELINGVLNIDSMPGRGTCVSVLVPLTDAQAQAPAGPRRRPPCRHAAAG